MATSDSPLEVLAFDYISFVFNNLWTWIAVVTAAVSFWRIRATIIRRDDSSRDDESSRESSKPQAIKTSLVMETRPHRVKVITGMEDWSTPLMCNDGVTKGKLTVYYGGEFDGETEDEDDRNVTVASYGDGERVVKKRNGDGDWYRYVDLTVINGNVVRLWDVNGSRDGGWVS